MDALFGLVSLDDGPLSPACRTAREAFVTTEQGHVTRWSSGSAELVCAARASRLPTSAASRLARSPSGRYQVALAGALHYRADLAPHFDLTSSDVDIGGVDDATLVAYAWDRWQNEAPAHIEGEFCVAIVDVEDRSVTLVQSRIEYAPLYYVEMKGCLGFSTRLLPLTLLPGVGRTLDPTGFVRAVSKYHIQVNDPRRTCVRGIEQLPAARARQRGQTADRDWEYWAPDQYAVTPYRSEEEVHLEIRARLHAAIAERVRDEQVVACLLSGGLDSSSLACVAASESSSGRTVVGLAGVLPTHAVGGREADSPDERMHIECVQRHAAIDVAMVTPAADANPWRISDDLFGACELPVASPRHYLYDALFTAAIARGAGLVLDGCYGELGPSFHASRRPLDRARHAGILGLGRAVTTRAQRLLFGEVHNGVVLPAFAPWLNAAVRDDVLRERGMDAEMAEASGPRQLNNDPNPRRRIGYPPLWRKVARSQIAGRQWNLETSCPFRDPRLWQYCAGLPSGLALRGGYNRYLVRAAMDGILPTAIQWRTTKGAFSPDYYARVRRNVEWARTLCASVSAGETAAQLIDLRWMRTTLTTMSPADFRHSNIRLVFLLQGTAVAIQYLRWFDRISQEER